MNRELPAIRSVLGAYRSESARITEEQITAAWAEYEDVRGALGALDNLIERVEHDGRLQRYWALRSAKAALRGTE